MLISVPIVMYGLGSFFVVLQVVQCLPIILAICIRAIGVYHLTKFHLSTLLVYKIVLPVVASRFQFRVEVLCACWKAGDMLQ